MITITLIPINSLIFTTCVVGVSTAVLPAITGYGTSLSQGIILGAWAIIAALTSGAYADQHHAPVWAIVFILNILFYLVPALIVWLVCRYNFPSTCNTALIIWCVFYLACLFFLFPATDGP